MIGRVASVAMIVSAIASQALAFDDEDLFSGWSEGDDAFTHTVAERIPQHVPVVGIPAPVEPRIAAIPSGIDAVVASQEVVNTAIVAPKKVLAVHNVGPINVVTQHTVPQVVAVKPVLRTTIHSTHHRHHHHLHKRVAIAQANFDKNLSSIKKVEELKVANGTSADLEKQLEKLRGESKSLAKTLYDAQQDITKTSQTAELTARKELSSLAQETEKERMERLRKRAENRAARLQRRLTAKRARIAKYNQKVTDINTKYATTKKDVVAKYSNSTSTAKQSLFTIRKNIRKLKMNIIQKKREELRVARGKINEQLKAAQDQVAKFNAELQKLSVPEGPVVIGHAASHVMAPTYPHHRVAYHHGVSYGGIPALNHGSITYSPHTLQRLRVRGIRRIRAIRRAHRAGYRAYHAGPAQTIIGSSGPVAVSTLPAKLAALATATNPKAAKRIAKRSRAITTVKAKKLAKLAKQAKNAAISAQKNAFKAAKLQYRARQAQREYVAASTTEATVHQAMRQTAVNAAYQAQAQVGIPTVTSNYVPVRYIN